MGYIPQLYEFFNELRVNNNRDWFNARKAEYLRLREAWQRDIERLRLNMAQWEPDLLRQPLENTMYRIYRDTRFSPDKTPYKTYFSAMFSPYGRKTDLAGYYFQLGDSWQGLFGGIWCADSAMVKKLRQAIVDNPEEISEILSQPELQKLYPGFEGESLKTAPKGFPKDHPLIEVLRMKQLAKSCLLPDSFFLENQESWPEKVSEMFRVLKPFIDFINYSIQEEI